MFGWLSKHEVADEDLLAKPGWLRFGFSRHYNPDLLEAMLAMTEVGVTHRPVLDDALDHIQKKRGKDGEEKGRRKRRKERRKGVRMICARLFGGHHASRNSS